MVFLPLIFKSVEELFNYSVPMNGSQHYIHIPACIVRGLFFFQAVFFSVIHCFALRNK